MKTFAVNRREFDAQCDAGEFDNGSQRDVKVCRHQ